MTAIGLKNAYAAPDPGDGRRILVDRLWPRGVSRERLWLDAWLRELAPSDGLRRWFGHDPVKWTEFKGRYFAELDGQGAAIAELLGMVAEERVTLVFAARDRQHNNAVVLRDYLEERLSPGARSGKEQS